MARLDHAADLRAVTGAATVLVNAAGPFAVTSAPLIEACIHTGTHYLDISGETDVVESTWNWHAAAMARGIMLMPGAGFEVVASDCLASHVARRVPGARTLKLGFDKSDAASRGSLKTCLEMSGQGVLIRRDGKLVRLPAGSLASPFDYGYGPQLSLGVSLPDTSSAFVSTRIPNIETYLRATLPVASAVAANQFWGWLLAAPPWKAFMQAQVDCVFPDPSPESRRAGWATIVGEVTDTYGRCARSRLRTGDVYAFTAESSVAVAERCLSGEVKPGVQTPSQMYGPDFALSFDRVRREDF